MSSIPHVNLIIATPGHSVKGAYVKSLLATIGELSSRGFTFTFLNEYASHVADAREITLSGTFVNDITNSKPASGQITYDKILWIDSDIAWKPEDAVKLVESDKDIVSGAYMLTDGTVAAYPKLFEKGFSIDDILEKTELEKIEACGFGFLAVKSGIFEQLSRPWFQSVNKDIVVEGKTYNFNVIGEDISWCSRVKDLGYDIWLDPTVRVTHEKTVQLSWEMLNGK